MGALTGLKKHIAIGAGAALLLLALYGGILALVQGGQHALEQTVRLWYWLSLLALGFGIQAGLFSFLWQGLKERRRTAAASLATTGGVSAGSMVACCAHHLVDVLPLLGLAGLATVLANYQVFFLVLGVVSNLVGITVMLETIQRYELCPWVARAWDMGRVKKGTMALSGLVLVLSAWLTII